MKVGEYRLRPEVRFRRVPPDEGVVVHQKRGQISVVNELGASILEKLQQGTSGEALVNALWSDLEVTREQLSADTQAYLEELERMGVVERVP